MADADTRQIPVPPGVDPARPSSARIYDYLLGGDNSFESDRAAAERLKTQMPEVADTAWANRGFHQRAAKWIAEQGVAQFIDIGPGLPALGNTHDIARRVTPQARIVYADNDRSKPGCGHSGHLNCRARASRKRAFSRCRRARAAARARARRSAR
jgi:hypothetical protein